AADEEPVADLVFKFVLRPAVAALAEWDFVPLAGLMIVADLCKGFALPHLFHSTLENVADVSVPKPVETADRDGAVIVNRHRVIEHGTRQSCRRRHHARVGTVLEYQADANTVDDAGPAGGKCILFVAVTVLLHHADADARKIVISACCKKTKNRGL